MKSRIPFPIKEKLTAAEPEQLMILVLLLWVSSFPAAGLCTILDLVDAGAFLRISALATSLLATLVMLYSSLLLQIRQADVQLTICRFPTRVEANDEVHCKVTIKTPDICQ